METKPIRKIEFINTLREKGVLLFTVHDIVKLFNIQNKNTLKHLLRRLTKDNIISPLIRGKYVFLHVKKEPTDYEIANFLVQPSYISLESALSYYGIIEQFPYKVISITVKRPKELNCRGKIFSYSRIKKDYFKDFVREKNYLIASFEKALFDYVYFVYNGLRTKSSLADLKRYLMDKKVKKYLKKNSIGRYHKFIKEYA